MASNGRIGIIERLMQRLMPARVSYEGTPIAQNERKQASITYAYSKIYSEYREKAEAPNYASDLRNLLYNQMCNDAGTLMTRFQPRFSPLTQREMFVAIDLAYNAIADKVDSKQKITVRWSLLQAPAQN